MIYCAHQSDKRERERERERNRLSITVPSYPFVCVILDLLCYEYQIYKWRCVGKRKKKSNEKMACHDNFMSIIGYMSLQHSLLLPPPLAYFVAFYNVRLGNFRPCHSTQTLCMQPNQLNGTIIICAVSILCKLSRCHQSPTNVI